jgi:copper chaperone
MTTASHTVEGMTCSHCVASVTKEVSAIPGVTDVDVALETGTVTVTSDHELNPSELQDAIAEAGYVLVD